MRSDYPTIYMFIQALHLRLKLRISDRILAIRSLVERGSDHALNWQCGRQPSKQTSFNDPKNEGYDAAATFCNCRCRVEYSAAGRSGPYPRCGGFPDRGFGDSH